MLLSYFSYKIPCITFSFTSVIVVCICYKCVFWVAFRIQYMLIDVENLPIASVLRFGNYWRFKHKNRVDCLKLKTGDHPILIDENKKSTTTIFHMQLLCYLFSFSLLYSPPFLWILLIFHFSYPLKTSFGWTYVFQFNSVNFTSLTTISIRIILVLRSPIKSPYRLDFRPSSKLRIIKSLADRKFVNYS